MSTVSATTFPARTCRPTKAAWAEPFHSSELWYVFGTVDRCWRPMTAADRRLSDRIVKYWSNFALTGDPNGGALAPWQPYTALNPQICQLDIE